MVYLIEEVIFMSKAVKALILTWVMIGMLVAGGIGFYLGRITAPESEDRYPPAIQSQGQQPLQGGFQQPPQGENRGGPAPSGTIQGKPVLQQDGQPNLPTGRQPPVQNER